MLPVWHYNAPTQKEHLETSEVRGRRRQLPAEIYSVSVASWELRHPAGCSAPLKTAPCSSFLPSNGNNRSCWSDWVASAGFPMLDLTFLSWTESHGDNAGAEAPLTQTVLFKWVVVGVANGFHCTRGGEKLGGLHLQSSLITWMEQCVHLSSLLGHFHFELCKQTVYWAVSVQCWIFNTRLLFWWVLGKKRRRRKEDFSFFSCSLPEFALHIVQRRLEASQKSQAPTFKSTGLLS